MQEALLNFCKWLENTSWALAIGRSLWAYPVVQAIHFSGLSLWVGTIVAIDLRFLGLGGGGNPRASSRNGWFRGLGRVLA